MEVDQSKSIERMTTTTFHDDASLEHTSIGFVKALQELKNLRPQLYSAAEYCEKSYLHSEQKQVVLDNLKDYAIRALVNAVDHLGTVAYKLTDLLDQQTLEISSTELHVTCLHQQLLTCQTYTDREAIRQQQLLAVSPRHHKHYILPNSVSKKVHFSPLIQTDARESHLQPPPRQFTSGTPAANTLSWHLATETKSTLKGSSRPLISIEDLKSSHRTPTSVHTTNGEEGMQRKSSTGHSQLSNVGPASSAAMQALGITRRDPAEGPKPMTPFRSFDNNKRVRAPVRSKSLLSSFFVKQKTAKQAIS
uniref:protein ABIL1-like n=1 Tax=Erigeron canadensis TaxID=72917 RepID=UPI001CB8C295|nr:protein ABIL1-like [Erigeron canadensis]XP_043628504.1 protein ABIL1-like [Erigeron canadensis]